MNFRVQLFVTRRWITLGVMFALLCACIGVYSVQAESAIQPHERLITVYDRGTKSAFLSDAKTLNDALQGAGIELDPRDTVEPSRTEELVAPEYQVNIYRARPVIVVDGQTRVRIISPYQTPQSIANDAGISVYNEDIASIQRIDNIVADGAGLELDIKRAVPLTLDLYGKKTEVRTQGRTVGDMLKEKNIVLGENGRVSVPEDSPIVSGMEVRVWREGKQTISVDEAIPFETEQIFDADREVGYRQVQTVGENGVRSVTYQVEITEGVETSRKLIASIDTRAPKKEVVIVGIKTSPGSLTKSKGAQFWTDSHGVSHRETYYDLDMGRVMQACGQGGAYFVRVDGIKVDAAGYVIIAANYGRHPRCSVVETSVGPAKVYDTGGFAATHPEGYDIATDWSNYNGR